MMNESAWMGIELAAISFRICYMEIIGPACYIVDNQKAIWPLKSFTSLHYLSFDFM